MENLPLCAGGEIDAIIDRYQSMVYGFALARTGSPADADDVFQETFLAYFQSGETFRDEEHRRAWFLRTALIIAAVPLWQVWREHRRWERLLENSHHDAVVEPFVESTASGTGDQDQDQEMTPDDLADAMADAGFSREDASSVNSGGYVHNSSPGGCGQCRAHYPR